MNMNFENAILLDSENANVPCAFRICKKEKRFCIGVKVLSGNKVKEAVLLGGEHGFSADTPFYGDGYQKLTQYKGTLAKCATLPGYTDKDHYKLPQP
ncbi:MAG: hypothetical protein ACI4K6_09595, partial [Candidatus Fimenecus sp.]